ncbi:phosphate ABC transporter permease PstA [Microbacterium sp.]|uniref:phosphate ABC transporter permease PstA n=1 Tax=Microbacterium sp. TaxID=51671 RepID=UPI003F9B421D
MTTVTTTAAPSSASVSLTANRLPGWAPWGLVAVAFLISFAVFGIVAIGQDGLAGFNVAGAVIVAMLLYIVLIVTVSLAAESRRHAMDRLMTGLVSTAFVLALLPLLSLLWTVVSNGILRFDGEFFSYSMRNIVGEGGGIVHAMWGTVLITLMATLISVPIGLMTSIYLVEYGNGGRIAKAITFFVDVMTGIPSIVAGLFIYSVFALLIGPGISMGFMGSLALSVLMIPVVVRGSEELLRIVPNELREASYALGVPKWLTIVKIVLPTSIAGIVTSIMLAIARVIGETAPLLLTAGMTMGMNTNLFDGQMMTLPVFAYNSYMNQGTTPDAAVANAWGAALALILIVMVLNLVARLIAKIFAPKSR